MLLYYLIIFTPLILLLSPIFNSRLGTKSQGIIYFYLIAVIAGLRFETGNDWRAYGDYLDMVTVNFNPFEQYLERPELWRFEPGFFLFNYIVKAYGFGISLVMFLASVFTVFSYVRLLNFFRTNIFFASIVYLGYPYLILHFNQIRQSISIAFFLILLHEYYNKKRSIFLFVFALLALSFHIDVIAFIFILVASEWLGINARLNMNIILFFTLCFAAFINFNAIDAFTTLKFIVPSEYSLKVDLYSNDDVQFGLTRHLIMIFLVVIYVYLTGLKSFAFNGSRKISQIISLTQFSILLSILSAYIFSNSYVIYSRSITMTFILLPVALSNKLFNQNRFSVNDLIIKVCLVIISIIFYFNILYKYKDVFVPYKSILG